MLNVNDGNFAPCADGARPAAASLFNYALFAEKGGVQAHINVSARLRGDGGTLTSLLLPGAHLGTMGAKSLYAKLH